MFERFGNFPLGIMLGVALLFAGGCTSMGGGAAGSNGSGSGLADAAASLGSVLGISQSAPEERTVEVMASGETLGQARDEAVRTALQATVSQLVISDRLVENSEVVRDDVFATQNGFVTSFEILEQSRSEFGEYELVARVSVSEDTIVNYVAYQEGRDSSVDGQSLFAEVRRSAGQRDVVEQMFRRFARGYPWDVVSLELDEIGPVAGHDDLVVASVTAVSDPDYFEAMEQFMDRVARAWYRSALAFNSGFRRPPPVLSAIRSRERADEIQAVSGELRIQASYPSSQVCIAPAPGVTKAPLLGKVTTGVRADGSIRGNCYIFPPGNFLSSFLGGDQWQRRRRLAGFQGDGVRLLVTFLDESGRSVVTSTNNRVGGCMLVNENRYDSDYPARGSYSAPKARGQPEAGLPFRADMGGGPVPFTMMLSGVDAGFRIVFSTDDVDFSRAAAFRGRPVFGVTGTGGRPNQGGIKPDLFGSSGRPAALCDELING